MNTEEVQVYVPVYIGAAIIAIAGAVGGGVNSALIHLRWVQAAPNLSVGGKSVRLTYVINIITGVAAALFSWGLYGPAGTKGILGNISEDLLSISSVFGAGLIGYSGSSWLTTHADKQEWKKNTQDAMTIPADQSADELSQQIPKLGPVEASRRIRDLHG
jgi:hypothetical protein